MKQLLANTTGQTLENHTKGVTKKALEILSDYNLTEENHNHFKDIVKYSAILHDSGKIIQCFQNFLNKQYEEDFVFHQYASVYLFDKYIINGLKLEKDQKKAIRYCIFWHHSKPILADKEKDSRKDDIEFIEEDDKLDEKITKFGELFDLKINEVDTINEKISEPSYMNVKSEKDITFHAICSFCISILIEADRQVSSYTVEELNAFLNTEYKSKTTTNKPKKIHCNSTRTQQQLKLTERLQASSISVLGADPGAGKTSISLLWGNATNNNKIYLLPKKFQINSLYNTINDDYNRIFNSNISSMQSLFGGTIQRQVGQAEQLQSEINITTLDKCTSSCYRREYFNELLSVIKSDLIFDEFHELFFIPNMLPIIRIVLLIRNCIKEEYRPKTLFMSGTPNTSVISYLTKGLEYNVFSRNELPEVHGNKKTFSYNEDGVVTDTEETLYSFNRVVDAQDFFLATTLTNKIMIHGRYTESRTQELIEGLFSKFGKKAESNTYSAINPKMLESSYDLSLKNAQLVITHPDSICQTLGRTDRFGNKGGGFVILHNRIGKNIWRESKEVNELFRDYIADKLQQPKDLSHREAMNLLYDSFFSMEEAQKAQDELLEKNLKESYKILKQNTEPQRYIKVEGKGDNKKVTSSNFLRGESYFVTAYDEDNGCYLNADNTLSHPDQFGVMGTQRDMEKMETKELKELNKSGFNYPSNKSYWKNIFRSDFWKNLGKTNSWAIVLNKKDYAYNNILGLYKKEVAK